MNAETYIETQTHSRFECWFHPWEAAFGAARQELVKLVYFIYVFDPYLDTGIGKYFESDC
jgi:hypothetical protein